MFRPILRCIITRRGLKLNFKPAEKEKISVARSPTAKKVPKTQAPTTSIDHQITFGDKVVLFEEKARNRAMDYLLSAFVFVAFLNGALAFETVMHIQKRAVLPPNATPEQKKEVESMKTNSFFFGAFIAGMVTMASWGAYFYRSRFIVKLDMIPCLNNPLYSRLAISTRDFILNKTYHKEIGLNKSKLIPGKNGSYYLKPDKAYVSYIIPAKRGTLHPSFESFFSRKK